MGLVEGGGFWSQRYLTVLCGGSLKRKLNLTFPLYTKKLQITRHRTQQGTRRTPSTRKGLEVQSNRWDLRKRVGGGKSVRGKAAKMHSDDNWTVATWLDWTFCHWSGLHLRVSTQCTFYSTTCVHFQGISVHQLVFIDNKCTDKSKYKCWCVDAVMHSRLNLVQRKWAQWKVKHQVTPILGTLCWQRIITESSSKL